MPVITRPQEDTTWRGRSGYLQNLIASGEIEEETGLELQDLKQFHTYSEPARDPRFHTITTVFSARAAGTPRAGDDAAEVHVVPRDSLAGLSFAFDHGQVLKEWVRRS